MDMCGAEKDPKLARLYTSRQRCMFDFRVCSIYLANRSRAPSTALENSRQTSEVHEPRQLPSSTKIVVDCEFYLDSSCDVMHRRLTIHEELLCSKYSQTCPLRERALGLARLP
jgi:hypothetical protein